MALTRKISNLSDVQAAIKELELKMKVQESDMKNQFADIKYNMQPKRLLNNSFNYLAETPEIQKTIINTAIGFILGFATKKATKFLRDESSLNRSIEGMVTHHLAKLENQNPDSVLAKGIGLLRKYTPPDSPIYPFIQYK